MTTHSEMDRVFGDHPVKWLYANTAARTGATDFVAGDIGRLAWQQDDNTVWMLIAVTPVWIAFGSIFVNLVEVGGNLGYKVASPTHEFEMEGDGPSITFEIRNFSNTAGHSPRIQFESGRGSPAAKTTVVDGDTIGLWNVRGATGASGTALAARVTWKVEGTPEPSKVPGVVLWDTSDVAGTISTKFIIGPDYLWLKERIRFGHIGIAASANSGPESIIGITDTTAARTVTILSADIAHDGQIFIIKDESGAAGTNNITIATEGAENIDGAATALINTNYGSLRMYSNGAHLFTI